MLKYAKITDEQTGLCEVGTGTNAEFYQSIGMMEQDVCQSSVDGNWYLSEKCPQKTYEQLLLEEKNKKHEENTRLAKLAVENGYVVFKGAEFETNAQTVGDLTATMLLMQAQRTLKQIQSDTTNDAAVSSSSANISETDNLSGQAQQTVILSDSEVSDTDDVTQDSSATPQNDDLISSQNEDSTSPQNADEDEPTYLWLSKDDKVVGLTLADFGILGALIADFKNTIWQEKYINYKAQIEQAQSVEAVNAIVLDYTNGGEE